MARSCRYAHRLRTRRRASNRSRPRLLDGVLDGGVNLFVAGAAAEVAGDGLGDLLPGRVRVLGEQRLGHQDDARRAEPALRPAFDAEAFLQGMELVALGHALDD